MAMRLRSVIVLLTALVVSTAVGCDSERTALKVEETVKATLVTFPTQPSTLEPISIPTPVLTPPSGYYNKRIDEFTSRIRLNPRYSDYYFHRGNAYYDLGQYQRAIEDYDKVIQLDLDLDPDLAHVYQYRGNAYDSLSKEANVRADFLGQKAKADFDKACSLDSKFCR